MEACTLPYILSQLLYTTDRCATGIFYRRSEMDDLVFAGSLIEEINQVDMRAECFFQCQWRVRCNLVVYNPLTRKCRLYTEAFGSSSDGTVGTGWQYYGVSCANYKLGNARVDVDVINADPQNVCNTNFIASDDNTSSCYTDASWEVVPVKCVSCYIGTPRTSMVPSKYYTEELTFDLAAGMKLRLEVSGNKAVFNHVWFVDSGMNQVYHLSLRWRYTVARAVFNTKKGRTYGRQKVVYGVSVNSISNYIIEVHISESDFMTYVDGTLLMTNQMRLPLTGVRRVTVGGFTALHSFHIGYVLC
ncbi:uncharacterized protein [Haliotis cracherodii]|uniref:uncharacterized protein n=1 Tax=Haliotis cracherodii TaxID=6455 RepID=UPI0039E98AD9